ncbi:PIR Superfamily Protein [Plasmodium ovale wallikeri]|uniref:PIR Superfamily Protein n=1 Tax=Plasmodium ovale wallikeri TaxID=864142 RepID=A0A1A9AFD2_PLAOA|nr:PIR Superfamily Protein [Plasmodium ovale wallikeri]
MPCKNWTGKDIYAFCMNSNYYEALEKYVKGKSNKVKEEKKCDNLSTSMTFSNNIRAEDICQEFKFLHKSLRENPMGGTTVNEKFSDYDCDFLNFWLNNKLRKNVNNGSIEKIQERESTELDKVVFSEIEPRDSRSDSSENQLNPSDEVPSPSDSHNAMAITFPFLGALSIFYSLYKFTPVGSLINSRFTRNKINNFDINEDEHELLGNEFDHEHMNISVDQHGIGYHPVQ